VSELRGFLRQTLGHDPKDLSLFERALTHSSLGKDSYERLEFLGDRVVGLVIARWLYERFEKEPEGKLSRRYNVLVSRETCAEIGRELGLGEWIKLGKQAREDGANRSDNVVGDVVEALIGALLLDGGLDTADAFIRRTWAPYVESQGKAPKHPKSALQELAASMKSRARAAPIMPPASRCRSQSGTLAKRLPKARASKRRKPQPQPLCWSNCNE